MNHYVESLPEEADDGPGSDYPGFGTLTVRGWLLLLTVHVIMHLAQIRAMQSQLDYPR